MQFGFIDAGQLPKWRRRKWPLPEGWRAAIRIESTGEIHTVKYGEKLHSEIVRRVHPVGESYTEGFVYKV